LLKVDFERLCRRLSYTFNDLAYLKQALTHRSASSENNERFEFVGDSVLNFVIANALFDIFPNNSEGELSRLRSYLVKGERLSEIAVEIKLGDYLILGPGELKTGGFRRSSTLADTLEAVFAAVLFDGGFEAIKALILRLYESRLQDPNLQNCLKDAKTLLQEFLQGKKLALPIYSLTKVEGDEHDQMFYVRCEVPGIKKWSEGEASNRRKAEQIAAKLFLEALYN
jgi:ribonuclease-3